MCGRFTLTAPPRKIDEHFELTGTTGLAPRFNVAPSQPVATVTRPGNQRVLAMRRWGLIPPWAKDEKIGNRQINARWETAADRPAFRDACRQRRCLIPADGFFEWSGPARARQPYFIGLPSRSLFAFAGLWESWRNPSGETIETCAILTMPADAGVRELHHRMPVVVAPSRYEQWLDPAVIEPERLSAVVDDNLGSELRFFPVSERVNDVRIDDAACVERADPPQLSLF